MPKVEIIDLRSNEKKEVEFEENEKIEDVLRKAGINPVEVIVKINDEIFPCEDKMPKDAKRIELIPVISGG